MTDEIEITDDDIAELFGCDYLERVKIKGKVELEKCGRQIIEGSKFCNWHTCGKYRHDLKRDCTNAKISNVHSCHSCNAYRLHKKTNGTDKDQKVTILSD